MSTGRVGGSGEGDQAERSQNSSLAVPQVSAFDLGLFFVQLQAQSRLHGVGGEDDVGVPLSPLSPQIAGDPAHIAGHVVNVAFGDLDSEALMVALKDLVAISNGSACTSSSYTPSHVLRAMGMDEDEANRHVRISWCHLTPEVDWEAVAARIRTMR